MAILLLQARTNSSRLPAKALLPIEGVPSVVLAAQRAANTGHRVIVLTSDEVTDNVLCDVLGRWNIEYLRGDLQNPLKRFVDALELVTDEQIVVRLTGDNVVPDGALIDDMLHDFTNRRLDYLSSGGKVSGLPYGISAEITLAGHLRNAYNQADTYFDCEHVTTKVIEKFGTTSFERYSDLGMHHLRCTIDTLDDYLQVCKLFSGFDKPEKVSLDTLLTRLKSISIGLSPYHLDNRIVLGTAQFGLNYGITNKNGKPNQQEINKIVQLAILNGIQYVDTARSYGNSEQSLGEALSAGCSSRITVITKLSLLEDCPTDMSQSVVETYVENSILKSCHALRMKTLDVVMLHRAQHLTAWKGLVWDTLCQLKKRGFVSRLGISVQSPEEALMALNVEDIEFIQLPFNILDYRWNAVIDKILEIREERTLVVHARSTLLQGLITSSKIKFWEKAHCDKPNEIIEWLHSKAKKYTNNDIVTLAIRYVCSQSWIDGLVIGVETTKQLTHNLMALNAEKWNDVFVSNIIADRPLVPMKTLNPAEWV